MFARQRHDRVARLGRGRRSLGFRVVDPRRRRRVEAQRELRAELVEGSAVAALLQQLEQHEPAAVGCGAEGLGDKRRAQAAFGGVILPVGKEDGGFVQHRRGSAIDLDGVDAAAQDLAARVEGVFLGQGRIGAPRNRRGGHRRFVGFGRCRRRFDGDDFARRQGGIGIVSRRALARAQEIARHLRFDGIDLGGSCHRQRPGQFAIRQCIFRDGERATAATGGLAIGWTIQRAVDGAIDGAAGLAGLGPRRAARRARAMAVRTALGVLRVLLEKRKNHVSS